MPLAMHRRRRSTITGYSTDPLSAGASPSSSKEVQCVSWVQAPLAVANSSKV